MTKNSISEKSLYQRKEEKFAVYSQKQSELGGSVYYPSVETNEWVEVSEVNDNEFKSRWKEDATYFKVYYVNPRQGKPKKHREF